MNSDFLNTNPSAKATKKDCKKPQEEIEDKKKIKRDEKLEKIKKRQEKEKRKKEIIKLKMERCSKIKLPRIQIPHLDKDEMIFIQEIIPIFKNNLDFFYKANEDRIVEIKKSYDKINKTYRLGFAEVNDFRLINLINKKVETGKWEYTEIGDYYMSKSISTTLAKLIMSNTDFIDSLNVVNRFFTFPFLYTLDNGELKQTKKGYNEELDAFIRLDSPEIVDITVEEAKILLWGLLREFCFKEDVDKVMAMAYLLTPACRGLYSKMTVRTPIFIISANREGPGKDYLAGLVGIIYEGNVIEDSPLTTKNHEEVEKRLVSALIKGRRRFHSSNNVGYLHNPYLEQKLTCETVNARILGKSKEVELANEIDYSLSANIGFSYSPDLGRRARIINLFWADEYVNERVFDRPDLHEYARKNRGKILSAIFVLIKKWYEAGKPEGKNTTFASYNEWAKTVGSIMEYHGLGNSCAKIENENVGGDEETKFMKEMFECLLDKDVGTVTIKDIKEKLVADTNSPKPYFDITDKFNEKKFSSLIRSFEGRILSGIKLEVFNKSKYTWKTLYRFVKLGKLSKLGNFD